MIRKHKEKIAYFLVGILSATGVQAWMAHKTDKEKYQLFAEAIDSGEFCPSPEVSADSLKQQAQEVYFTNCGGFF